MNPSATPAVAGFFAGIAPGRSRELERVREVIRENLPRGYEEALRAGMVVYEVPLALYPDTYNGHPLWYAALAAPKSHLALHLMNVYASPTLRARLEAGFLAAGKKLHMGKACVRFKSADDLALDVIGQLVASTPVDQYIAVAKAARQR